jgi:myo-inositol-1(or 4)-monophosphatase
MTSKIDIDPAMDDSDLAVALATRAGTRLLDFFDQPARRLASKSSPRDLVSDADRAADALIVGALEAARPDDGVLSEERAALRGGAERCWIVDPLDGTTNFLHGYPVWCVSIALRDRQGELVGVVHDPLRGETFAAERGRGARLDGVPLRLADATSEDLPSDLLALNVGDYGPRADYGGSLADPDAGTAGVRWEPRLSGCLALDLAWVAAGRLGAYCGRAGSGDWDWAAGKLLVEQAGGSVTILDLDPPALIAARAGQLEEIRDAVERAQ